MSFIDSPFQSKRLMSLYILTSYNFNLTKLQYLRSFRSAIIQGFLSKQHSLEIMKYLAI